METAASGGHSVRRRVFSSILDFNPQDASGAHLHVPSSHDKEKCLQTLSDVPLEAKSPPFDTPPPRLGDFNDSLRDCSVIICSIKVLVQHRLSGGGG